jgi:hypothetical protein
MASTTTTEGRPAAEAISNKERIIRTAGRIRKLFGRFVIPQTPESTLPAAKTADSEFTGMNAYEAAKEAKTQAAQVQAPAPDPLPQRESRRVDSAFSLRTDELPKPTDKPALPQRESNGSPDLSSFALNVDKSAPQTYIRKPEPGQPDLKVVERPSLPQRDPKNANLSDFSLKSADKPNLTIVPRVAETEMVNEMLTQPLAEPLPPTDTPKHRADVPVDSDWSVPKHRADVPVDSDWSVPKHRADVPVVSVQEKQPPTPAA